MQVYINRLHTDSVLEASACCLVGHTSGAPFENRHVQFRKISNTLTCEASLSAIRELSPREADESAYIPPTARCEGTYF